MTDIQSLLNIISTPSSELEQSTLPPLTHNQLTQVKQLQQVLQHLNLPTKTSQQLLTALVKDTVNVTNLSVTDNKLSFSLAQLTPKLVELSIPNQTLLLRTDKAELSVSTNLTNLLINLPKQSIKLPQQTIFELLKRATNNSASVPNKIVVPASIINSDNQLIVKANSLAISAELSKNLTNLVKHQQPAIIEVEHKSEQLKINVKLDKNSQPVQSQILPIKKAIELIKLQSSNLLLNLKQTPEIQVNGLAIPLPHSAKVVTNQTLPFTLNNLGDKAVLNLPSQNLQVKLNAEPSPLNIVPRDMLSVPQPSAKELSLIQRVATTDKSFNQSLIGSMLESIKTVLFERNITLKHASKGSLHLPKLIPLNEDNSNTQQTKKSQNALIKLPVLTQAVETLPKAPTYKRPITSTSPTHKETNNLDEGLAKTITSGADAIKSIQHKLENIAKQNPLQTLTMQLNKTLSSSELPDPLAKLVNHAFNRMINESSALQPTMLQIKSIIAPLEVKQRDSLQTPIGAIEHVKIALAATGLSQQARLIPEQQGKLENLLPLLLNLTKALNSKKEGKSQKGQLSLSNALQRNLSDNLNTLQKGLQGNLQATTQQTTSNEQPLVNMQFSLPQQQTEKLATTPITIQEEKRKNDNGEITSIWHICLAFEIQSGILNIAAELNQRQLSLNFSSDHTMLINQAKSQAPLLAQKLTQHGLDVLHSEFVLTEQQHLKSRSGIVNIKV